MLGIATEFATANDWRLTAAAGFVCFLLGLAAALLLRRMWLAGDGLNHEGRLLDLAVNNMTQGVVMFDHAGRLVVRNDQYLAMYGLSADVVRPGATLVDIVAYRAKSGSLTRDPEQYCAELRQSMAAGKVVSFTAELPDGRSIAVVNRAIPEATIGSAPMMILPSAARQSSKTRYWASRRRAARSSMRPLRGFVKASRACSRQWPTALRR